MNHLKTTNASDFLNSLLKVRDQEALTMCGKIAAERGVQLSKEQDETNLAILRDSGMVVAEPNDTLLADLVEKVGKPMLAEWLETADESSAAAIAAFQQATTEE